MHEATAPEGGSARVLCVRARGCVRECAGVRVCLCLDVPMWEGRAADSACLKTSAGVMAGVPVALVVAGRRSNMVLVTDLI